MPAETNRTAANGFTNVIGADALLHSACTRATADTAVTAALMLLQIRRKCLGK